MMGIVLCSQYLRGAESLSYVSLTAQNIIVPINFSENHRIIPLRLINQIFIKAGGFGIVRQSKFMHICLDNEEIIIEESCLPKEAFDEIYCLLSFSIMQSAQKTE
jgi:hypothetical protein